MRSRSLLAASLVLVLSSAAAAGCTGDPDESEAIGQAEQAQKVCADGATIEGIDVSVYQADIDWPAVKADGIGFAIARASYGTTKDSYFDQNWAGMKAAGVIRGAYQYWRPDKDAIAQADAMINIMGTLEPGDLPPVIDVEETDGVSPATLSDRLDQWLKHVEAVTGKKPIIYSGKYFWQDNVQSDAFLDYPLWIPNYSLDCPDLPTGYWPDWQFFQYTSSGHVNGVSGNVDRDTFNGSLQDLKNFASQGGAKYGAEFVSQSFPYASEPPVEMVAGQPMTLSIELKNTGSEPWNELTKLATTEPRDRESPFAGPEWPGNNRYAQVQGVVMPGETYTFTWIMHPPKTPGIYDEHFGLVQEGVAWFGDQAGPPDAQLEGLFQVEKGPFNGVGLIDVAFGDDGDPNETTGGGNGTGGDVKTDGNCSTSGGSQTSSTGLWFAAAIALSGLARRRRRG